MITRENTTETEKEVLFVDALHESLVNHKIITNPRVIQCGTYYSKERGYFRYRIKCGNIKECPRCRDRTLDFKRHQMLKTQEECLSSGGSLFIITGTLKHKKTDSLRYLQKKLRTAVSKLKNQKGWRKFQKQTTHPTRTVYETTYSQENGYHPHVHMMFHANNQIITQTELRETLNDYWRTYTGANLDVTKVDEPTVYVGGKSYYPESLDDLFKQQKDVMKKNFAKEELEIELVMTDSDPHYEPPLSVESILTAVKEINQNQSYYKER